MLRRSSRRRWRWLPPAIRSRRSRSSWAFRSTRSGAGSTPTGTARRRPRSSRRPRSPLTPPPTRRPSRGSPSSSGRTNFWEKRPPSSPKKSIPRRRLRVGGGGGDDLSGDDDVSGAAPQPGQLLPLAGAPDRAPHRPRTRRATTDAAIAGPGPDSVLAGVGPPDHGRAGTPGAAPSRLESLLG